MTTIRPPEAPGLRNAHASVALAAFLASTCVQQDVADRTDAGLATHPSDSETRFIDGNAVCADCQIEYRNVVTLGSDADPASVWEGAHP